MILQALEAMNLEAGAIGGMLLGGLIMMIPQEHLLAIRTVPSARPAASAAVQSARPVLGLLQFPFVAFKVQHPLFLEALLELQHLACAK